MQRQLSREYGKLKRTFGFSDSLLARMRAEESDVARYAMMQDGIQDFMRRNYRKDVDGVKVGLGTRTGCGSWLPAAGEDDGCGGRR